MRGHPPRAGGALPGDAAGHWLRLAGGREGHLLQVRGRRRLPGQQRLRRDGGRLRAGHHRPDLRAFNPHELVHAYLRDTGFPPALLLEGAAVALSCASWRRPQPAVSWREAYGLSTSGPRANEVYNAGGWLAGYLLATRGTRAFVDLYRDAGDGQSAAEFAATFTRIYGESLDDVWTEMIAAGRPPAFCPWECSRPQAPLDGVTPVASDAACGVEPTHAITLAQPSELVATLTGVSNFSLGILRRRLGSARDLLRGVARADAASTTCWPRATTSSPAPPPPAR